MDYRNRDIDFGITNMTQTPRRDDLDTRIDARIDSKIESRMNMYERQIDQLFDFTYRSQDDIKTLFNMNDGLAKDLNIIDKRISDTQMNELKTCINNYYHLELDNKRRMEHHECYQFQLFIVQIFIICYLTYLRFI